MKSFYAGLASRVSSAHQQVGRGRSPAATRPHAAFSIPYIDRMDSLIVIYGVVTHIGFQFNQERSIKIIILGELKILARKPLDRVDVVPDLIV
jgi:hypothetical protein